MSAVFISPAEREWYEAMPVAQPLTHPAPNERVVGKRLTHSPAEQTLCACIEGRAPKLTRLAWAYEHARKDSVVKELLAARLRIALGLKPGEALERVTHG